MVPSLLRFTFLRDFGLIRGLRHLEPRASVIDLFLLSAIDLGLASRSFLRFSRGLAGSHCRLPVALGLLAVDLRLSLLCLCRRVPVRVRLNAHALGFRRLRSLVHLGLIALLTLRALEGLLL